MESPRESSKPSPSVEVALDGVRVQLSLRTGEPAEIRTHLESLALRTGRILQSLKLDGQPVITERLFTPGYDGCKEAAGVTMALEDLGHDLARIAIRQIRELEIRLHELGLQVLINDATVSRRLWWLTVPHLKEPLMTIAFIPEHQNPGVPPNQKLLEICRGSLATQLGILIDQLENTANDGEPVALAEMLESRLLPWYEGVRTWLEHWNETTTASTKK